THSRQLEKYKAFLKRGGEIYFKTDDDELFTESLEYFKESGFELTFITYDMTENSLPDNIITEHEKMFMDEGIKIKGLIARYPEE
ncbi:MAG: tRNA (guanosine(46)-N7)-methyltransferase TrmB, partial [Oscillospiraceae bacterium]|nr:tRNA (guanosine(46)-N7)-methyltransferase TrmB [Oscillospiraceae bacterium]